MRRFYWHILLCLTLLFITSCTTGSRLLLKLPTESIPLTTIEKSAILEGLKANSFPSTLRAMLDTSIQSSTGRESFLQALTFKSPDLFRLEAFATGVNALIFLATSNKNQFKALIPNEKKVLQGRPTTTSLDELIQLPLTPIELVALVTGRIFPEFLDFSERNIIKDKDGSVIMSILGNDRRELGVRLNPNTLAILELSLSDRGSGALNVIYHYKLGSLNYLEVSLPDLEAQVVLREVKTNTLISSDSIFTVNQPAGYRVVQID